MRELGNMKQQPARPVSRPTNADKGPSHSLSDSVGESGLNFHDRTIYDAH